MKWKCRPEDKEIHNETLISLWRWKALGRRLVHIALWCSGRINRTGTRLPRGDPHFEVQERRVAAQAVRQRNRPDVACDVLVAGVGLPAKPPVFSCPRVPVAAHTSPLESSTSPTLDPVEDARGYRKRPRRFADVPNSPGWNRSTGLRKSALAPACALTSGLTAQPPQPSWLNWARLWPAEPHFVTCGPAPPAAGQRTRPPDGSMARPCIIDLKAPRRSRHALREGCFSFLSSTLCKVREGAAERSTNASREHSTH